MTLLTNPIKPFSGYACVPYLHNHESIELKDLWASSRNVESLFFVTATFSEDSKPYFSSSINHFKLAKFKNTRKVTHGVVISPDSRYAFVSVEGIGKEPGAVEVFDLKKLKAVATAEIGKQAGGIAFWKMDN